MTSGGAGAEIVRGIRRLEWEEALAHSRRYKSHLKAISGQGASWKALTLTETEAGEALLFALGQCDDRGGEQTLLMAELKEGRKEWPWQPFLRSHGGAQNGNGILSKEQELRMERQRLNARGVTAYSLLPSTKASQPPTLLFSTPASVFLAVGKEVKAVANPWPHLNPIDPQAAPGQPDLIAWVGGGDVRVVSGETGLRVTELVDEEAKDPPRFAGSPSFVVQEEFDRYSGLFWSPVAEDDNSRFLLFEEVDERDVDVLVIGASGNRVSDEAELMRYPRAGTVNAQTTFALAKIPPLSPTPKQPAKSAEILRLKASLSELFPWAEYIPRLGWLPDGSAVYAQIINRRQNHSLLLHIPVDFFAPKPFSSSPAVVTVLRTERSEYWVNVNNLLTFLPSSKDSSEVEFIWGSEKSGFCHLYKVKTSLPPKTWSGGLVFGEKDSGWQSQETPITSGDWVVLPKIPPVLDTARGHVYFVGLADSPIESHVYVASYAEPSKGMARLTELGRSALFARHLPPTLPLHIPTATLAVTDSSLTSPHSARIYKLQHPKDGGLPSATVVGELTPPVPEQPPQPSPIPPPTTIATTATATTTTTTTNSEDSTRGVVVGVGAPQANGIRFAFSLHDQAPPRLFRYKGTRTGAEHFALLSTPPASFPEKTKRPLILYVYGGPEVQLVKNVWAALPMLKFTSLGYCVLILDGRGSANRGLAWEGLVKEKMGQEEMGDQVEGLRYVASQTGDLIDLDRVAVTGWSYGGFLSLWALTQFPDIFKVAMAGGPVTDYTLYDTAYTERYMGTPQQCPAAYAAADLCMAAQRIPATPGRLLILHGIQDENVHLKHSLQLLRALQAQGKFVSTAFFPGERHGIRSPAAAEQLDALHILFLQDAILKKLL